MRGHGSSLRGFPDKITRCFDPPDVSTRFFPDVSTYFANSPQCERLEDQMLQTLEIMAIASKSSWTL